MTGGAGDLGWSVAGVLLVVSGLALCVRARAPVAGVLFCLTGILVVISATAGDENLAALAVVALSLAVLTYPQAVRDPAQGLALGGVVVGVPALAVRLAEGSALDGADLVWITFAASAVALSHLWWRLETLDPAGRGPLLWVVSTSVVVLFLVGVVTLAGSPRGLAEVVQAMVGLVGVSAWVGLARGRHLDGRRMASRAAAWSFTVACLFAAATLTYSLVEWAGGRAPGVLALALVTIGCGVAWHPLLRRVARLTDRALFGFRPDPLAAAERLAGGIGDDPAAAVGAIREGLLVPYAALILAGEPVVAVGSRPESVRTLPLVHGDERLGTLVVGVRPGDLALSDDDERVLALAVPLLVQVVRARARAADLQRARVAATSVREEERRRLRRDLHDGLGPRLTGIAFTADAARLASSDETRLPMLDRLRDEAATAIQEIRDLVDGLRPPALDELGLLGALSLRAESFPNVDVVITADALPVLPAAVEVAAYRIVAEALTNVARHSGAGRADVVLGPCDTHLAIEVRDDGRSDAAWVVGVGLSSMRERASELGGTVSVDRSPTGTVVAARLPLGPPA